MSTIDPELLMRYADDELGMPERRLVEEKLRTDPNSLALIATFRGQRDQLSAALTTTDDEESLRRLEETLDRAVNERRRKRRQSDIRRWALPIAASLLITLIGGMLSIHYADQRAGGETARLLAAQAHDRELALETRIEALERMLSGNTLTWMSDRSGTKGSITPLRTFRTPAGQWCREYRETTNFSKASEERLGIACRDGQQGWAAPPGAGST